MTVELGALPPLEVASRAPRIAERLDELGCDALLVTRMASIRYLTGFTGSAGVLLLRPAGLVLVTDGRYGDQAAAQLAAAGVDGQIEVTSTAQRDVLSAALAGLGRLGLEADAVTWAQQRRYREWFPQVELVPTTGAVEAARLRKDAGEVARIRAAAGIVDDALAAVAGELAAEPTEAAFALSLDTEIRRRGATGVAFETIVASGPNGALPHWRPGDRRIREGDLVVVDVGAIVDGYRSDMTRTFSVGEPSGVPARMLEVVTASQAAGVGAVGPGVEAQAVDAACRAVLEEAGWAEAFLHGTGHGVGLDIHEAPRLSARSEEVLEEGMVVTVEPGVYLPDHGGVRVEDTVVVTGSGCTALTAAPKEPVI